MSSTSSVVCADGPQQRPGAAALPLGAGHRAPALSARRLPGRGGTSRPAAQAHAARPHRHLCARLPQRAGTLGQAALRVPPNQGTSPPHALPLYYHSAPWDKPLSEYLPIRVRHPPRPPPPPPQCALGQAAL